MFPDTGATERGVHGLSPRREGMLLDNLIMKLIKEFLSYELSSLYIIIAYNATLHSPNSTP